MRSHEPNRLLVEGNVRTPPVTAQIVDVAEIDSPAERRHRVTVALWWLIGILLLLAGLEPLVLPNTPPTPDWVKQVRQSVPAGPIKP